MFLVACRPAAWWDPSVSLCSRSCKMLSCAKICATEKSQGTLSPGRREFTYLGFRQTEMRISYRTVLDLDTQHSKSLSQGDCDCVSSDPKMVGSTTEVGGGTSGHVHHAKGNTLWWDVVKTIIC
jgi:hypothetical protein